MILAWASPFNLLQYLISRHLTRKLSGISPVSTYTIFVYVHLFKDNIYLQNFKCNRSITVKSSTLHASAPYAYITTVE